jgi:hypothetical protein
MRCDEQLHWDIYEALKGEIVDDVSIYIYIYIFINIIILGAWSIHGGLYFLNSCLFQSPAACP